MWCPDSSYDILYMSQSDRTTDVHRTLSLPLFVDLMSVVSSKTVRDVR